MIRLGSVDIPCVKMNIGGTDVMVGAGCANITTPSILPATSTMLNYIFPLMILGGVGVAVYYMTK